MIEPQMFCSSPEVFAILADKLSLALFLGVVIASAIGKFFGEAAWYGLHVYLLRRPSWRRFDRAMRQVHS